MDEPFPHGLIFGGNHTADWYGQFAFRHDQWFFSFLDEEDNPTDLYGQGYTPKEAFERLVFAWTFANGGVESQNLKTILPDLRWYFTDDGQIDEIKYRNTEVHS